MFKYLKFTDETSDKFWQICTDGLSHTVTYGRNGTSGQSKTKTFASEEACASDAEKLIADKIKKGYSEDLEVSSLIITKPTEKKASLRNTKEEVIDALRSIILNSDIDGIIPFLDRYSKNNLAIIKKEIKSAKRYWVDYVDLSEDKDFLHKASYHWGIRGTKIQQRIVKLLALATFSGTEVGTWNFLHELVDDKVEDDVVAILEYAKPNWLESYILQLLKRNSWNRFNYRTIRFLEESNFIKFEPELFASSFNSFDNSLDALFLLLTTDPIAIERDIPLVFEYETFLQNFSYSNRTDESELLWDKVFDSLLASGKIAKDWILRGALEAQTKNWDRYLKSYFRKLILRLNLTEVDKIQYQQLFFPLLQSEEGNLANFSIEYLRPVLGCVGFDLEEFLDWAEGLFMRHDIKKGIKTLIIQFDNILKQAPSFKHRFLMLVADVFIIPDLQLQERAATFLLKHQKSVDKELSDKLLLYRSQMLGSVAFSLKELIVDNGFTEEELLAVLTDESDETYIYVAKNVVRLNEPIIYPKTWNEILFKIGEVIGDADVLQIEVLMNSWVQNAAGFPADYKVQLEPYMKQLQDSYKESACFQHFMTTFFHIFYKPNTVGRNKDTYANQSKWCAVFASNLELLQERLIQKIPLPLLSLPTHHPFWIAPKVLVERLLMYQEAKVEIDLLDLSIALSRVVREELDDINSLVGQIEDIELKDILRFAFGFIQSFQLIQYSWFDKLIHSLNTKDSLWIGLWATVARTHYPDTHFEQFSNTNLRDVPFGVEPFRPELIAEEWYYDHYNYKTKKKEKVFGGINLSYSLPVFKKVCNTFLYAKDLYHRDAHYFLYHKDVPYMHSLMPQNTESLSMFLVLSFNAKCGNSDKRSGTYLREMLYDFFSFDKQSYLYLASSMFNKEREVRALATEVLVISITKNILDVRQLGAILSFLMNKSYGPIGRILDVLEQCRDISAKHNSALFILLEHVWLHFVPTEKIPANLIKMVELYYDLFIKCKATLSDEVKMAIQQLNNYKSLQGLIKKII